MNGREDPLQQPTRDAFWVILRRLKVAFLSQAKDERNLAQLSAGTELGGLLISLSTDDPLPQSAPSSHRNLTTAESSVRGKKEGTGGVVLNSH